MLFLFVSQARAAPGSKVHMHGKSENITHESAKLPVNKSIAVKKKKLAKESESV